MMNPKLTLLVFGSALLQAHADNGTWTNATTGGNWSDTANWLNSIPADGSGFNANFNTLDITADNTVHMDGSHTLTSLTFGDTTVGTAGSWIIDNNGNAANILTLAGATPTVTVNALGTNKNTTISAIIDGTAGLTKAGAGILSLSGNNTYTGATTISAGGVALSGTNATTSVAVGTNTLGLNAANALAAGTAITASTGTVVLGDNKTTNANLTFNGASRGTFYVGNNADWAGTLTINASSSNGLNLSPGATNAVISGNIANNSTGNLTVRNDTGSPAAIYGATITGSGSLTISGVISGVGGFQTGVSLNASTVTLTGTNTYTGNTTIQNGSSRLTIGNAGSLGSGNYAGNISFATSGATFRYDSTTDQTLSGNITGAGGVLTKSNTSTLTLTGATISYTGATNVNGGTLRMNGTSTGTGAVTVASGARLEGTGSVAGAVNVTGTLAPGASIESLGTGALTFNNGSTFAYELNSAALNGDLVDSSGSLTFNGTVNLTLTELASGTLAHDTKLTLIAYTGAWNNGTFTYLGNALADDSVITLGGNQWKFDYNDAAGNTASNFNSELSNNTGFVTMTVVPEPSVALLGGLGALALLRRRRNG